jgi:hypothetical protein
LFVYCLLYWLAFVFLWYIDKGYYNIQVQINTVVTIVLLYIWNVRIFLKMFLFSSFHDMSFHIAHNITHNCSVFKFGSFIWINETWIRWILYNLNISSKFLSKEPYCSQNLMIFIHIQPHKAFYTTVTNLLEKLGTWYYGSLLREYNF